ncbi:Zinc finger protein 831 [Oryzias melastigma]|uniref:Zinc finger protein 831 n=1 Tax=Oryzias melastigma TaxID=30732 RepID=A0A834CH33_ORYME|nr:Zinc finger protein 831 [Oryzias melastigma]
METSKPTLGSLPVHISSVATQAEKRMAVQAPLTALYIHPVPALPLQPYPQSPAAPSRTAALHLAVPPLTPKDKLPFLTLHIASGLQPQPSQNPASPAAARPKSAGKHVCPHCGRDCMKPSVLEKHLRCHTGERPYPCTTCGVSFKTQSNLYKHKRTQAHARLSSESEHSSLDSSRENCVSSLSLDEREEESAGMEKNLSEISIPASNAQVSSVHTQGVSEHKEQCAGKEGREKLTEEKTRQKMPSLDPHLTFGRHLPLQRQEAMLLPERWERSVSKGKSQSHESTDSGFSESSDHYPSPRSSLTDHSMDSLSRSFKESIEETSSPAPPTSERAEQEPKAMRREQEQRILEERISKLISENTAVVEDKQLENVRPRKTVLSKQGSIDLPMPYTYKDSFHFDMRINGPQKAGLLQKHDRAGLYCSVPTQRASTVDHAPLTRSNSLPFSVTLLQPETAPSPSHHNDYISLARRGSSGQIHPTGLATKPVNQHSSTHRTLVRQTAVDCNHATDALLTSSAVEEARAGSLSCDGDEVNSRKFRRKKAQKFAYNKWYMYGGGTFKKLYSAEQCGDSSPLKSRKCSTNPEHESVLCSQKSTESVLNFANSRETSIRLPVASSLDFSQQTSPLDSQPKRNVSWLPRTPLMNGSKTEAGRQTDADPHPDSTSQLFTPQSPSDRKKQRTEKKTASPMEVEADPTSCTPDTRTVLKNASQENPELFRMSGALLVPCMASALAPPVGTSGAMPIPSVVRSSFLPKYQLKLPHVSDSSPSQPAEEESKTMEDCGLDSNSKLSSAKSNSICANPTVSPQSCDVSRTPVSLSDRLAWPGTVTALCQASCLTNSCSLPAVHRQFAATTITTSCLKDYQRGLSCSLSHTLKSAAVSAVSLSPLTPAGLPSATATQQTPAAAVTSRHNPPPPTHKPSSESHVKLENLKSNSSAAPYLLTPSAHAQPAPNVFHMHTADLQICLQIISDEQLALIEHQIERPADVGVPQSHKASGPDTTEGEAGGFTAMENEKGNHTPLRSEKTEGLKTTHQTPQQSAISAKGGLNLSERENTSQGSASAGSLDRITVFSAGTSTAASPRSVQPRGGQNSEEKQAFFPTHCAEKQLFLDWRVRDSPAVTQTLSKQHENGGISIPNNSVHQNRVTGVIQGEDHHRKPPNPGTPCLPETIKSNCEALGFESRLESGDCVSQAAKQLNPQRSVCCHQSSHTDQSSPKEANIHHLRPTDTSSPSLQLTAPGSEETVSSELQQKTVGPFSSLPSKTPLQGSTDAVVASTGIQNLSPGLGQEHSLEAGATGGALQTREHAGTPVELEDTDWRSEEGRRAMEEQGGRGVSAEDHSRRMWIGDVSESGCRNVIGAQLQADDKRVQGDSFKTSQHLQYLSQAGTQSPQQAPDKLSNLHFSASGVHTDLFNLPSLENNHLYPPQQNWASSSIHSQQTRVLYEPASSGNMIARVNLSETQNVFARTEPDLQKSQGFSQKQLSLSRLPTQQGNTTVGHDNTAVSCQSYVSHTLTAPGGFNNCGLSPEFLAFSSASHSQVSQVCRAAAAGRAADVQPAGSRQSPSTLSACPQTRDTTDVTPQDSTSCGGADSTSKHQSAFLTGLFRGFQAAECLSAARPVQPSCQDDAEETSSSDDEGKLIIEL